MNKLVHISIIILLVFLSSCATQHRSDRALSNADVSIADRIRKSNVVYNVAEFQKGIMHVPPYIANGIVGGCFDHMGFQSLPRKGVPNGRTVFGYIGHYYMHKPTTRQAQLPLAYIQAEFADGSTIMNMMDSKDYRQELDIYNGVLTTHYDLNGSTTITAFAHQTIPGLFVMKINRKSNSPEKEMVVKINCEAASIQQANIGWPPEPVKIQYKVKGNVADIVSSTNMVNTKWMVIADNPIQQEGDVLNIRLKNKENIIKIFVRHNGKDETEVADASYAALLKSHTAEFEKNWERSWIDFPEEKSHHIWNRANYYNLSNFPVVPAKALIPTGMNTNIWGFTFPQDVYYVAENLLRSGHFDRYKKSMKYWLDILPEVKKYSLRTMNVEGGFYPWTPPFGQWDEFEKNGVVGNDSYEIHNPAYVSAMVWHYYQRTGDKEFLTEYFPIMEEVWKFYSNVVHKNTRGTFDVDHHKAAGQDEASRLESSKNLLCASYSAEYSARNFIEAAQLVGHFDKPLYDLAKQILDAGFERKTLMTPFGFYATYEGDNRPLNSQKHPVQLNAITFCPMGDLGTAAPSLTAHQKRYDLTINAKKPISMGWTFAAFALASSRLGQPQEFTRDMSAAQYCAHADPRWIQFYEFTFWERYTLATAYYFPTQGLYQQAYTDALVQDWQGYVNIFACMTDEWKKAPLAFKGLYTLNGVSVDGKWDNGKINIMLHPNGASNIKLKISTLTGPISVGSEKNKLKSFNAGEIVTLEFDGDKPIRLFN